MRLERIITQTPKNCQAWIISMIGVLEIPIAFAIDCPKSLPPRTSNHCMSLARDKPSHQKEVYHSQSRVAKPVPCLKLESNRTGAKRGSHLTTGSLYRGQSFTCSTYMHNCGLTTSPFAWNAHRQQCGWNLSSEGSLRIQRCRVRDGLHHAGAGRITPVSGSLGFP